MPELPEVETVRRGLLPVLVGRRLLRVVVRRLELRWPLPNGFGQKLKNKKILEIRRRGKFLLTQLDNNSVWVSHLGMSGRFGIYDSDAPPIKPHDHIIFETDDGVTIRYNDPRRFGFMDLKNTADLNQHPTFLSMGPEPLDTSFTPAVLEQRLKRRNSPIKSALLDQRTVAGLGNIYVCEALHQARISPKRLSRSIKSGRAKRLHAAIVDVLTRAINAGGSSLRDHRQADGELGYFQHNFSTFGRVGEGCPRCGLEHKIQRIVQSGRSTFYCSNCQR